MTSLSGCSSRRFWCCLSLLGALLSMSVVAECAPRYSVTSLGTWGVVRGLNNSGQVVGICAQGGSIWDNGTLTYLGSLAPDFGNDANAINDLGQVVGVSAYSALRYHAFIWDKVNGMRDLGSLDDRDTRAYDINNSGLVLGYFYYGNTRDQAFLWDAIEGMRAFGAEGCPASGYPVRVNDPGQIVGTVEDSSSVRHAAIWDVEGNVRYLDGLDTGYSTAAGINDLGQVIGMMDDIYNPLRHAPFLWDPVNGVSNLRPPDILRAQANDINNLGDVVGMVVPDDLTAYAVLWSGGEMFDLNTLIPEGTGIELGWAYEINDHGQIVAAAAGLGGVPSVYYLLTPIPEPSSLAALAVTLAGLCATRRRRRA